MSNKMVVVLSDVHLEIGVNVHESYKMVKRFIKANKPNKIVIAGDFLDFSYISTYSKDSPALTENKRLSEDVKMCRKELKFMEKYSNEVIYMEGNHEKRLDVVNSKYPTFTEDLITIPALLGIDYWVKQEDQPMEILPDLYCMHGHRYGVNVAMATLKDYMENIIFGHVHRIQTIAMRTMKKTIAGYSIGCLSDRAPKYLKGRHSIWNNGFAVIDYDNDSWNVNNIIIEESGFFYGGKKYK